MWTFGWVFDSSKGGARVDADVNQSSDTDFPFLPLLWPESKLMGDTTDTRSRRLSQGL